MLRAAGLMNASSPPAQGGLFLVRSDRGRFVLLASSRFARGCYMARTLKTFTTSAGFFDLAVSAPSMKAALEAWGSSSNLFHQGFATLSEDPEVVAATKRSRRPIGHRAPSSRRTLQRKDSFLTLVVPDRQPAAFLGNRERIRRIPSELQPSIVRCVSNGIRCTLEVGRRSVTMHRSGLISRLLASTKKSKEIDQIVLTNTYANKNTQPK